MYLLSSLGLIIVWWRMTSWLRPAALRNVLRISAAVALVMPYPVPDQESFLAPALMMTFLEGLFFEDYGFGHAGIPLVLAVVIANILYLLADLLWQPYRRRRLASKGEGVHSGEPRGSSQANRRAAEKEESGPRQRKTPTLSS